MTVIVQWTGREARALRLAIRMGVRQFAEYLGINDSAVSNWERRGQQARLRYQTQHDLDTALARASDEQRERFYAAIAPFQPDQPAQVVDNVTAAAPEALRGADPDLTAANTVSVDLRPMHEALAEAEPSVSGALMAGIEQMRHRIDRTLAADGAITISQVAEREATVQVNARQCVSSPPVTMLCRLALDVAEVQDLIMGRQRPPIQQGLYRVMAQLATLIADELMVLGEVRQSRAWHGTARFAADQTQDKALRAVVRCLAALLPLYYGDPVEALMYAREARDIGSGIKGVATVLAPTYEALGLAQLGHTDAGILALAVARDQFARLDHTYRTESVFNLSERRWRFYEGKILSYLGRTDESWAIHDEALALYPRDVVGDPALIRFDRAISLVRGRETAAGCEIAEQALLELPQAHRTDIFLRAARRVLSVVPPDERDTPPVRQYREAIRACSGAAQDGLTRPWASGGSPATPPSRSSRQ